MPLSPLPRVRVGAVPARRQLTAANAEGQLNWHAVVLNAPNCLVGASSSPVAPVRGSGGRPRTPGAGNCRKR
eukprot:14723062-Alexandrium_andersonii.AAC.1